jgi:hypothetical protein
MPSWYNVTASYGDYGNSNIYDSYCSYTISYNSGGNMIIPDASLYEASKNFTLGRIYQAFSNTALYDNMGHTYFLDGIEIKCFEEVDIGLNMISKRFMEKQINSGKMEFQFNFLSNNIVMLKMTLNGKHSTCVSLMGVMAQINEMLHNAYIALRKAYINNFKAKLEVNYRRPTLIGGRFIMT